jgi:SAM-dependent methyltransferase
VTNMLSRYFNKKRQECWRIIDREYPEEKDKYAIVSDLVEISLRDGSVVLDAGCGHRSSIPDHFSERVQKIGIDRVLKDIRNNKTIDWGICSNIDNIPLKDESVDLIICNMVFEHLEEPQIAFSELSRILKKGGYLIFMTPCIYNVVTLINKIIPNRFHKTLGNLLTGAEESDIFPTYYKANSRGKLKKILAGYNLTEADLIMYQPPPYAFVFSKIICRLVISYYHLINKYYSLSFLRGVIIARYQKE